MIGILFLSMTIYIYENLRYDNKKLETHEETHETIKDYFGVIFLLGYLTVGFGIAYLFFDILLFEMSLKMFKPNTVHHISVLGVAILSLVFGVRILKKYGWSLTVRITAWTFLVVGIVLVGWIISFGPRSISLFKEFNLNAEMNSFIFCHHP